MEKLPLVVSWAAAAVAEPDVETAAALGEVVVPAAVVVGATTASGVGVVAVVTLEAPLTDSAALAVGVATAVLVNDEDTVVVTLLIVPFTAPAASFESWQFLTSCTA